MREIKFRQYLPKKSFKWHCWGFIDGGFIAPINNVIESQQYTGLKDMTDREIYEGDIVKGEDVISQVVYIGSAFRLNPPSIWNPIFFQYPETLEVIGNIYEHSHLLNK